MSHSAYNRHWQAELTGKCSAHASMDRVQVYEQAEAGKEAGSRQGKKQGEQQRRADTDLKDWVIPQAVLGFAAVIQLVLTWELIVSHILASHNSPAPFFVTQPTNEQVLCMSGQTAVCRRVTGMVHMSDHFTDHM